MMTAFTLNIFQAQDIDFFCLDNVTKKIGVELGRYLTAPYQLGVVFSDLQL